MKGLEQYRQDYTDGGNYGHAGTQHQQDPDNAFDGMARIVPGQFSTQGKEDARYADHEDQPGFEQATVPLRVEIGVGGVLDDLIAAEATLGNRKVNSVEIKFQCIYWLIRYRGRQALHDLAFQVAGFEHGPPQQQNQSRDKAPQGRHVTIVAG
jgi:hypothetical protein